MMNDASGRVLADRCDMSRCMDAWMDGWSVLAAEGGVPCHLCRMLQLSLYVFAH